MCSRRLQYDGRGQLPVEHPKGKTKLECMQDILPKADDGVHQNILVANDGGVSQAVQVSILVSLV